MPLPIGHLEKVRALAVSGRVLVVGGVRAGLASQLTFYDHVGEKPEKTVDLPSHVLAIAADDAGFVVASADGVLRWFSPAGALEREIKAHAGGATSVAVRGDIVASAGVDGAVSLWSRKSGAKRKGRSDLVLSSRPLRAVAVDPAGEAVAAAGDDGVVRCAWLADGRVREMAGHEGGVLSLVFTPADGRLVSGGEDGTTRLWYLAGAVEADVRGRDDTGHAGGTTAIAFLPSKNPEEVGERFFTAGRDGKMRLWRTSERRKPRTFEPRGGEGLHAIAIDTLTRAHSPGRVFAAGDLRTVFAYPEGADGQPQNQRVDFASGFDVLAAEVANPARGGLENKAAQSQRRATVTTLAALAEPEALDLAVRVLEGDRDLEVRAHAAAELAKHRRMGARKALRGRIDDESATVRAAAYAALSTLEKETPLTVLRVALESKFADMRIVAVRALVPLFATSPLVQGLIADRLADSDPEVRRAAVAALIALHPADPATPLRAAFERGAADVRAEVLVRGVVGKLLSGPTFAPIIGKALDDEDAEVRRLAFAVQAIARPTLLAWLEAKDEAFGRALADLLRRVVEVEGGKPAVPGLDSTVSIVKAVSVNYAQFIHPTMGDVAIFRPTLHTPLTAGDKVRLIGLREHDKRAADYLVGEPGPTVDPAATRAKHIPAPTGPSPNDADREPLLAALACRNPDTSLRGARGLALLGDMRALGALLTISRDPDAGLRREAAFALVALRDRRAERRIAWMMNDPAPPVRDAALTCFATLQPGPLTVASTALQSAHEDVRTRGLDILVKQGRGNAQAEALLQSAFEDEAASVRAEAFRTLWAWHTADPMSPLDRALAARFADVRLRAVNELAAIAKHKEGGREGAARERLFAAIGDRDAAVATAAYQSTRELRGETDVDTHLAAIASPLAQLRVRGANDSAKGTLDKLRSPLTKLLEDAAPEVRVAAIEALHELLKEDHGPLYVGLQSSHLDLRVRAAELLAVRRDEQIISAMQSLIADEDLLARMPSTIAPLRRRAATALANLGSPKLLRYFATELILDKDLAVCEQAARGVSNASRRGEEGFLLDLLGHKEIAVRSWAGEGLARLGDARAVPVLTGTLRHNHPPIRVGAILSFAALGPEGYGGMLQGLEDASREVQRIVLTVILARDLRAFRAGEPPELLATALSSQRPEVRFAAARAIELRMQPEQYTAHLVEALLPDKPERTEDLARWPDETARARLMVSLAEALAGDRPEQRYAAAQALRLRDRPETFFREVRRAVQPRASTSPWVPETSPSAPPLPVAGKKGPLGMIRRLFAAGTEGGDATGASEAPIDPRVPPEEQQRLRLLAFGAYVGLLRQGTADDEAHRVRRDAIDRVVDLVNGGAVSASSATPALARALDDPNHLVRRAALAGLRAIYTKAPDAPLSLALASSAADVVRAALDDLAARGDAGRARIVAALDSNVADARRYAFELLEKAAPPGSLEPLLAALGSAHADLRIGVLERLATSRDGRVVAALGKALESDHEDLRLRAAELLASRRDERGIDVLAACLRTDDEPVAARAREALAKIGTTAAIAALAARVEEVTALPARLALVDALAKTRGAPALEAVAARFADEDEAVRRAAIGAALAIVGPRSDAKRVRGQAPPKAPDQSLALRFCEIASKSRFADARLAAAARLDDVTDAAAEGVLVGMFGDRSVDVRAQAVASYAARVEKKEANPAPLGDIIRGGARETMLAAAAGLATRGIKEGAGSFRPLLLFVRAGESGERERAILGLGALGDARALAELEVVAGGGTEEIPVEESMQAAALEALGRLFAALDEDAKERVRDRIESNVASRVVSMAVAAVKGLRWIGDGRSRARIAAVLASGVASDERRAAAEAIGALADASSEAALAKALDDADGDVRDAARAAFDLVFPTERTRVELWAVESKFDEVSAPAAAFLAAEGDPGQIVAKLAKVASPLLRQRLRFGLARRASVPGAALAGLLEDPSAFARSDAAWLVAVGRDAVAAGDRVALGRALVKAALAADAKRREARRRNKSVDERNEREVTRRALWAARRLGAAEVAAAAKALLADADVPVEVRVEAARALDASAGDVLRRALSDPNLSVRAEAASSLGKAEQALEALQQTPLDPVTLGRVARPHPLPVASFDTPERRRILAPLAIGTHVLLPLFKLAQNAKAAGRLEAIAQLGLTTEPEAIAFLRKLAAKASGEPEAVRKAAFRALRRAQRRAAQEARP